jgi:N-acetylneuraminic acid mutarotase
MKLLLVLCHILALAGLALSGCSTAQSRFSDAHSAASEIRSNFTALPETVTSFGAVTADGWLYVFGGHKGERHEYSADMVSGSFHRLRLSEGRVWQPLPSAATAQGLPLVAHDGYIYRIGGMAARNPAGAKQDLYSMTLVQRFDPQLGRWEETTPLTAPRSSHDAVVIRNKLYVAGGWQLTGGTNKEVWPANALVLDLANPRAGWREFPQPFQRRALALAALGSRVYCIGGMNSDNKTTLDVDIYDTSTDQWTKGPDLPAGKHKGFSCSAIAQNGRIYVSAFKGDLLRLAPDERSWEIVGRLQYPRMSHRLVAAGATQLIALGGEDGEDKRPELELLTPATTPILAGQATATQASAAHGQ